MATFYEFFAGGGMARAGLGSEWTCLFANDFDETKAASYRANWGDDHLWVGDVAQVSLEQLPGAADLAWASFPCQDLSLAGSGTGLIGKRSGTFWSFWSHIENLRKLGRAPATVVLENVYGAITSQAGRDFLAIIAALSSEGYRCGAIVVNAVHFLPQSRPRLFVVAVREEIPIESRLHSEVPVDEWHPQALRKAHARLTDNAKQNWIWWHLPQPMATKIGLADLIEKEPKGVKWHSNEETSRLLCMMNETNSLKVETAKTSGLRTVGTIYKRTRTDGPGGSKVQRAEVRFDNVAGCLRTPSGGSSRQTIIIVEKGHVRTRLLSPREAARLMGLSDKYLLPERYNDAYRLAGDGVAVPVVRFIAANIVEPILLSTTEGKQKAA